MTQITPFGLGVNFSVSIIEGKSGQPELDLSDNPQAAVVEQAVDKSNRLYAAQVIRKLLLKLTRTESTEKGVYEKALFFKGVRYVETTLEQEVIELERFYLTEEESLQVPVQL